MVDIAKETNDKLSKASNSNSKEETLIELAFDNSPYVREKVASNINCTDTVFDILIKDEDEDVLLAIALNTKCSARYLDYLYKRNNKKIKCAVLSNPNCSEYVTKKAIESSDPQLLEAILNNPNCSREILERTFNKIEKIYPILVGVPEAGIELYRLLIRHSNCPSYILSCLTLIKNYYLNVQIFLHPNTYLYNLIRLSKLPYMEKYLNMNPLYVKHINRIESNREMISDPNCPSSELERIYNDKELVDLKSKVIAHPNCPKKILDETFNSESNYLSLLSNPNCPQKYFFEIYKVIMDLIRDRDSTYRYYERDLVTMLSNINCPIEILENMSKFKIDEKMLLDYEKIFISIIDNPKCTRDMLKRFAFCKYKSVRKKALKKLQEMKYGKDMYLKFKDIAGTREVSKNDLKEIEIQRIKEDKEIDETRKQILEYLAKTAELVDKIERHNISNKYKITNIPRVRISDDELLVKVDDHFEIKPEYLQYINIIDLQFLNTDNIKANNMDYSRSNIRINPQTVYKKDLSGSKFNDSNITFKNFSGCNLCGSDLSEEYESLTGLDEAIIDENTKLPKRRNVSRGV